MTLKIQDKDAIKIPASALETMATLEELGAILVILALVQSNFTEAASKRAEGPRFLKLVRSLREKGIASVSIGENGTASINLNLKGQEL